MTSPYESDILARKPDHTLTFTQTGSMWILDFRDDQGELVLSNKSMEQEACLLNIRQNLGVPDHVLPLLTTIQRRELTGIPDGFCVMDTNQNTPHTLRGGNWYRATTTPEPPV